MNTSRISGEIYVLWTWRGNKGEIYILWTWTGNLGKSMFCEHGQDIWENLFSVNMDRISGKIYILRTCTGHRGKLIFCEHEPDAWGIDTFWTWTGYVGQWSDIFWTWITYLARNQALFGHKIRQNYGYSLCRVMGEDVRCMQGFGGETWRKECTWKT